MRRMTTGMHILGKVLLHQLTGVPFIGTGCKEIRGSWEKPRNHNRVTKNPAGHGIPDKSKEGVGI
jgi:hypothetical protein